MIKAIIFDFDGVIHDTLEIVFKINKKMGVVKNIEEYRDLFNGNFYKNKKITKERIEEFFKLQAEEFKELELKEEIKNELVKLKKRFNLFIITSNQESTIKNYFERNNSREIFKDIFGIETHKSKEEKFKKILKENNLSKDEVIFITDTLGDILEANNLGIKTIAVERGYHERERLEKGNPFRIIKHIKEIEKILL